jgi:hypothetical protein
MPAVAERVEVPIERLEVSAYTIPTEEPEADGTLAWDSTTIVVVELVGGGQRGLGYTYSDSAWRLYAEADGQRAERTKAPPARRTSGPSVTEHGGPRPTTCVRSPRLTGIGGYGDIG